MSWRDQMRPGSFRGVPFYLSTASDEEGRLAGVHQAFASGEDPRGIPHDNGRALGVYSIEAFVAGEDYLDDLQALKSALFAAGPGDLVHPFYGSMSVVVLPGVTTTQDAIANGGMATVRFKVKQAGRVGLRTRTLPSEATRSAAAAALDAAAADFGPRFSVADLPTPYQQSSTSAFAAFGAALADLETAIAGGAAPLTNTLSQAADLGASAAGLLSSPNALASTVIASAAAVFSSARTAADAAALTASASPADAVIEFRRLARSILHGARTVFALPDLVPDPTPVTQNRAREAENLAQVRTLVQATVVAEVARTLTWTPYASRTEALAALAELLGLMDLVDLAAGDSLFIAQATLRQQIAAYLKEVARNLPEVTTYTTADWTSSVLIAHALYGDATRADEVTARNGLTHPGKIAPGLALEVLVA